MTPTLWLIPGLAVTVFVVVRAAILEKQWQVYVLKPLSTLIVIAVACLSLLQPERNLTYTVGVLLALMFSLAGDVALMFEERRGALPAGLGSFLLAHVTYAVVFTMMGRVSWWDVPCAGVLLAAGAGVYALLRAKLGVLRIPVIVYTVVISIMVSRAIATLSGPAFGTGQAVMIAAGAVSFYISDAILAVCRFRRPWRYRRISLVFYYGGQLLIALAASGF